MKMIGIVDALGIESFIPLEGNERRAWALEMRATLNTQRNALNYCLDFTDEEIETINNLIAKKTDKGFVEAGIIVTKKLDAFKNSKETEINEKLQEVYKIRGYL